MMKEIKTTFYGPIPKDWIECLFEDVIDGFSSGMTPYRGTPEFYKGDIPWITSGELNYNVITDTHEKITKNAIIKTNLKILPIGTFLMAITGLEAAGTRGSCGITGVNATTNQSCMALFPKVSKLDSKYLYHFYVKYGNELAFNFCQGTKQQSYTGRIAKILPINIPPTLTEQKAIATALSDVDALIASLEQTITKKKAIKQGAMQQLLTPPHKGGKRLPGFSGDWVEKTLGEVGECIRGVTYSGDSYLYPFDNTDSIRLLRSNNVFDKNILFKNLQYVKKEKVNSRQFMKSKDILICMANGSKALVGKAGQFKGANMQYTFGAFMGVLRPNLDEWDGDFVFNLFSTYLFRCHLDVQLSGSSINNLNPSDIENFKFYSPSNQEQKAIAQILSDMDVEITQLESKKAKHQAIKQGMMQELLTGKTRLV